uniref:Uncharacterized protein n=1 Tax=Siphoviridae sp. ctBCr48 TaxID=2827802 RepID=A0A8S5SHA4_9CAUD|nr:MAG TPA: hypothetical protein [Siphoviridae sp. ctBCr48]
MEDFQRSSPCGRVEPQTYGGRKIQPLFTKGEHLICSHIKV